MERQEYLKSGVPDYQPTPVLNMGERVNNVSVNPQPCSSDAGLPLINNGEIHEPIRQSADPGTAFEHFLPLSNYGVSSSTPEKPNSLIKIPPELSRSNTGSVSSSHQTTEDPDSTQPYKHTSFFDNWNLGSGDELVKLWNRPETSYNQDNVSEANTAEAHDGNIFTALASARHHMYYDGSTHL